jgi:hypothetical protein
VLGSPNGVAVGYFLAQHKAQLGNKKVASVQVFGHNSNVKGNDPVLMFKVE